MQLFILSEPQFPRPQNGDNTYIGLVGEFYKAVVLN